MAILQYDVNGYVLKIECDNQEVLDQIKPVIEQTFPDATESPAESDMQEGEPGMEEEGNPKMGGMTGGIAGMACGTVGKHMGVK